MMNPKEMVVSQDNRISQTARAQKQSFKLSVFQTKLLWLLISKINKDDKEFRTEEITFTDYCTIMNISKGGKTNQIIRDSVLDLCNKNFWIDTAPGKSEVFSWIESGETEIDWNNKIIRTRLGRKLKPYYLELSEYFTSFQLGFTTEFSSKHSYRLYEYLRSYVSQEFITIKIDKAYEIFSDNTYNRVPDLERRVLNKAIEEINQYSDITCKYTKIKEGNKVTHLTFVIKMKSDDELDRIRSTWKEKSKNSSKTINGINDQAIEAFSDFSE